MCGAALMVVESDGPPQPSFCSRTLRLRGLPFSSTIDDIRDFFAGYAIEEVHICKQNGMNRMFRELSVVTTNPLGTDDTAVGCSNLQGNPMATPTLLRVALLRLLGPCTG